MAFKHLLPPLFVLSLIACGDSGPTEPKIFELSRESIDFGNVELATTKSEPLDVTNLTGRAITLELESASGDLPPSLELPSPPRIPANSTSSLRLSFSPTQAGPLDVTLTASAEGVEQALPVTGMGASSEAAITVTPELLAFGNTIIDSTRTLEVTITNTGSSDAMVEYDPGENIRDCADSLDSAAFCILLGALELDEQNLFELGATQSATVSVRFTPELPNARETGNFAFRACPACAYQEVRTDGVGVEFGLSCTPASAEFGTVNPNTCRTESLTCSNTANRPLTVLGWDLVTASSTPTFRLPTFPGDIVLGDGESFDLNVDYCPVELGRHQNVVRIQTSDGNNPDLEVPLDGVGGGPDMRIEPRQAIDFGEVSLIAPARRYVTIHNVGVDPLTVSEMAIDDTQFTLEISGAVIEPGESVRFAIDFQPIAEATLSASLTLKSDDPDTPEHTIEVNAVAVNLPPCSFSIEPVDLDFGVVQIGRVAVQAATVRNSGSSDCLITGVEVQPGSAPQFSLPELSRGRRIAAGGVAAIPIAFRPDDADSYSGDIEIAISSNSSTFNNVRVTGTGGNDLPMLAPTAIDFGSRGSGCGVLEQEVRIYNTTVNDLTVDDIRLAPFAGSPFALSGLPQFPLTITSGDGFLVLVTFDSTTPRTASTLLEIESSGASGTLIQSLPVFAQSGSGLTQVDSFIQGGGDQKADVLFMVQHSPNEALTQNLLADGIGSFFAYPTAANTDFHVGITTTDISADGELGRLAPTTRPMGDRYITRSTPNPIQNFQGRLPARPPSGGAAEDLAGLGAAFFALGPPNIPGFNSGFLRFDASLGLVYVTDNDDRTGGSLQFFLDYFRGLKGPNAANSITVNAIAGRPPNGCLLNGTPAIPATRLFDIVSQTGGVFQTYCLSNWSSILDDVASAAFGRRARFLLRHVPDPQTIRVFIDGVELPETNGGNINWALVDTPNHQIVLNQSQVPEGGAEVRIEYTPACS